MKKPKHISEFEKKLVLAQVEILAPTNEYELLRFRCKWGIGLVYRNKRGVESWNEVARQAESTLQPNIINLSPAPPVRRNRRRNGRVTTLLHRDGADCFYCRGKLAPTVPDDLRPGGPFATTQEHVASVAIGGPNHLDNTVLAHSVCNQLVGDRPVIEKVKLRENWPYAVINVEVENGG